MLDLTLFSHPTKITTGSGANTSTAPMVHSRRPSILTYASPLVDRASRISYLPLYLTGWHRESETLDVQMMEEIEFSGGWRSLPSSLRLEMHSDERMQVYSVVVGFKARFTGLRYYLMRLSFWFLLADKN